MTAPTIEIELVEEGTGTLKYLVAETGNDPWIAQNIDELLADVYDFDKTDVFLLTEQMQVIPVHVDTGAHEEDWWVALGEEPGGEMIEHITYAEVPGSVGLATEVHEQHVNGWPDPAAS